MVQGTNSMIAIGAVLVSNPDEGFLGYLRPEEGSKWDEKALAVSGFTREETLKFPDPYETMRQFYDWILAKAKNPFIFVADNNGFDFAWTNWYFLTYCDKNPFGWSSKNINNLYQGLVGDTFQSFKHLRQTPHDHNPMNDAKGNAEALIYMKEEMGLKAKF
jgi:hypothetical protein